MDKINNNSLHGTWYLNLLCLILIIVLNPVTFFFNCSPRVFTPDTVAYITMARELFDKGFLYIPSWCHGDQGLICPPLYPFLMACGNLLFGALVRTSEWVSSLCALIALVPIYAYVRRISSRSNAVMISLLIGINYYYFVAAMTPLSEATFLLTLSYTLVLTLRLLEDSEKNRRALPLLLGLSCALVFLSRQIGIIILVFLVGFFLLHGLFSSRAERAVILKKASFMVLGWLILVAPYTIIIYYQTGHHPLQQSFSSAKYEVTTDDPEVLREIQRIENIPNVTYGTVYAKRRLMRKLLPDASEMLYRVDRKKEEKAGLFYQFLSALKSPKDYAARLYHNTMHLAEPLGNFLLYLFLILCISPFFVKSENRKLLDRLLLPLFILFYLLVVSCFTDRIPRYIYILFPFALMHIAGELFVCFHKVTNALRIRFSILIFLVIAYAFFLLVTPHYFTELSVSPKLQHVETQFESFRKKVNGEPVFSLSPFSSYLSGGSCRLLPNDSLEKVVKYGKKTGVRWLLVDRTESALSEIYFYTNAEWYRSANLQREYPHLVRFCCETADGSFSLYEIL